MSSIEKRIHNNKKDFDVYEPEKGHFERFQSKLNSLHNEVKENTKPNFSFPVYAKIAAVAIIFLAVYAILYDSSMLFPKNISNNEIAMLEQQYIYENEQKLKQIENIVAEDEELQALKDKAMHKVVRLQDNTEGLKKEYVESNKNEKVYSAIVTNYRLLSTALDKVIDSMNEIKYKKSSN